MTRLERKIRLLHPDFDPNEPPPPVAPVPHGTHRPLWSVMIPTFNCASYLRQTLESVLAQDPSPDQMQIEVVDDCSTKDDPEAVVREVGKGRVQFYRKSKNEGAVANFNTCIERSRGYLVHILHGDDYVLPEFYIKLQETYERYPDASAFASRIFFTNEDSIIMGVSPRLEDLECGGTNIKHFYYANPLQFAGVIVKRSFYERHGGFSPLLIHTGDWQLWIRAFSEGGVVLPDVLAAYRVFSSNDTARLMQTAENLRDRERLALYLTSRFSDFSFNRAKREYLHIAVCQYAQFLSLKNYEAARANAQFWNSRATLKDRMIRLLMGGARRILSFCNI